ncbi:hypothetical protein PDL03_12925 [Bacillus cereus]|nr:hypothetical protein [Bacillus cereus]MDA2528963.1 hypothetical protein [Bacillus cereus]HDX9709635.1 hypothetical protein [Bacillus cereus]
MIESHQLIVTIRCDVTIEQFETDEKNRIKIIAMFTCVNQVGKEVMKGSFSGIIL